jgi:flagellar motor switch/type III secretory pathway protein FliN
MTDPIFWSTHARIRLVIARLERPIEQVMSWKLGQVIQLEPDTALRVDLVVDGRTVARGELVDVEGRLGVRVL